MRITAEFVTSGKGPIFVVAKHPQSFDGRCVLVVPPFAEEMNKSRRMISEFAVSMVSSGFAVVVPDFYGTGDSEGDFSETDCETWLTDLATTEAWIQSKGWSLDSILGIRLGCLIAAHFALKRNCALRALAFWQPVLDGTRAIEQFLRLRVAASLMEDKKETVSALSKELATGHAVEVAGYQLSPSLAAQMENLTLPAITSGRLHWFEVLRAPEAAVPRASSNAMEQIVTAGVTAALHTVIGKPFWATTEIEVNQELLEATSSVLAGEAR
jgi:exosortase A-associated hydrolase 2